MYQLRRRASTTGSSRRPHRSGAACQGIFGRDAVFEDVLDAFRRATSRASRRTTAPRSMLFPPVHRPQSLREERVISIRSRTWRAPSSASSATTRSTRELAQAASTTESRGATAGDDRRRAESGGLLPRLSEFAGTLPEAGASSTMHELGLSATSRRPSRRACRRSACASSCASGTPRRRRRVARHVARSAASTLLTVAGAPGAGRGRGRSVFRARRQDARGEPEASRS